MSKAVGARVRALRIDRGLSQADLAVRAGIAKSYVSRIETSDRSPNREVLQNLARALGCTRRYLETGADSPQVTEHRLRLQLAEMALADGEPDKARDQFMELTTAGGAETILKATYGLARAAEALGDFSAAAKHLESLVSHARAADPGAPPMLELNISRCRLYSMAGDVAHSIEIGELALADLRAAGLEGSDEDITLSAWLCLAYWTRGDLTASWQLAQQALERADQAASETAQAAIYWHATILAAGRRDYALALDLAEKARAAKAGAPRDRVLARLRVTWAALLMHATPPRLDEADVELAQAHELLTARQHQAGLAACETEMARSAMLRGDAVGAAAIAQRAMDRLSVRDSYEGHLAGVVHGLALLRIDGQEDEGAAEVDRAAHQLQLAQRSREAAAAWRDLAEALLGHGKTDAAIAAFRRSSDCGGGLAHLPPGNFDQVQANSTPAVEQ